MIRKELLFMNKEFNNKDEVFKFVAKAAKSLNLIESEKEFIEKLYYRESLMSTSLDFNMAIPHAKSNTIKKDFISFIKLSKPILWNDTDEEVTNKVFMIAVSEGGSNRHLKYIADISRKMIDEEFRKKLDTANDVNQIYELLVKEEK